MKLKLFLTAMLVSFTSLALGKTILKKSFMNSNLSLETVKNNGTQWLSDDEKVRLKDLVLAETGKELLITNEDVDAIYSTKKNAFVLKSYKKVSTKEKTQANLSFLITAPLMLLGPDLLIFVSKFCYKTGRKSSPLVSGLIASVAILTVFHTNLVKNTEIFSGFKKGSDRVAGLATDKIMSDKMAASEQEEILDLAEINSTASSLYQWLVWGKSEATAYLSLTEGYALTSFMAILLVPPLSLFGGTLAAQIDNSEAQRLLREVEEARQRAREAEEARQRDALFQEIDETDPFDVLLEALSEVLEGASSEEVDQIMRIINESPNQEIERAIPAA